MRSQAEESSPLCPERNLPDVTLSQDSSTPRQTLKILSCEDLVFTKNCMCIWQSPKSILNPSVRAQFCSTLCKHFHFRIFNELGFLQGMSTVFGLLRKNLVASANFWATLMQVGS